MREQVAVGVEDALGQPGRARRVVELRRVLGERVLARRRSSPRRRAGSRRRAAGRARPSPGRRARAFARLVTSTLACESLTRWRMPSSPYRIDIESRIAPHFQVPKNAAAVSGVGGSSIATRSPFSTPCARRTLAKRLLVACSSPHATSRTLPRKSSWIIASLSARVLVADVLGDVVALGDVPFVLRPHLVVRAEARRGSGHRPSPPVARRLDHPTCALRHASMVTMSTPADLRASDAERESRRSRTCGSTPPRAA